MCLVSFKVKNYKSYRDEIEFSFKALDSDFLSDNTIKIELESGETISLLKTAIIYGPNASGKSNLIWALKMFQIHLTESRTFDGGKLVPFSPFCLDDSSLQQPTEYSVDFIVGRVRYSYSFSHDANSFLTEKLIDITTPTPKLLFSCSNGNITFGEGWRSTSLDLSQTLIHPKHLLLSELALKPSNMIDGVYKALTSIIAEPVREIINLKTRLDNTASSIYSNFTSKMRDGLQRLISCSDFGISQVELIHHDADEFRFPESIPQEVQKAFFQQNQWEYRFTHSGRDGKIRQMPLTDESTGTQHMLNVGALVLDILSRGGILAYDEMNMALHPQLFKLLIKLFHNPKTNPLGAQLIFTCHDTSIVSDNLMRADQVWFTSKNGHGESELYSAQDFEDINIQVDFEEWYRRGRFGAVPSLSQFESIFDSGI